MDRIVFEAITKEDVKDALILYNHYIRTSTSTFSIAPIKEDEMVQILFSGMDRFPSYKILFEGKFVGYVLLNRYKPREAYDQTAEVTVYLDEAFQGRGIGYEALKYIENFARNHNFRALLGVICAENTGSIRLFEGLGYFKCGHFKEVGKKFDRLLDVVIYEKLLEC
ncbi:GNAT family N-acetyltransferase [Petrocella sp. FN5]|uniref:GNAT family N-acetyltransferase n=1 Tax=Petrocella sp. FN5 TaxID=3032002 RepID=UPI0023DC472D|nr:GNAT family N-acetyltransferase [Petrocella sp. FN5]MDF1617681.1 GNAT family N-acetyltransferase [Petrocella sp. FN5]